MLGSIRHLGKVESVPSCRVTFWALETELSTQSTAARANVLHHVTGVSSVPSFRHSLSQMITPNTGDVSHIPLQQHKPTHWKQHFWHGILQAGVYKTKVWIRIKYSRTLIMKISMRSPDTMIPDPIRILISCIPRCVYVCVPTQITGDCVSWFLYDSKGTRKSASHFAPSKTDETIPSPSVCLLGL